VELKIFLLPASAFLFGAVIGSFLNVVIYRLPREESLVRPASRCTSCGTPVRPWQNIPLISWLILGGRCRSCRSAIPIRYPLVEGANALLYAALALRFGPDPLIIVWGAYCSALIVVTGIDFDHQIIPDVITLPGMAAGLAFSLVSPLTFVESITGLFAGGAFFYAVAALSEKILGKPGMGGGDIKLTAMMGAFLGPASLAVAVFAALLSGSAVSLVLIGLGKKTRKDIIPFGPFLALGGIAALFSGREIAEWYLSLTQF
jgi:leader peptidase (prepilin peptidase)/N-methyltransferase